MLGGLVCVLAAEFAKAVEHDFIGFDNVSAGLYFDILADQRDKRSVRVIDRGRAGREILVSMILVLAADENPCGCGR